MKLRTTIAGLSILLCCAVAEAHPFERGIITADLTINNETIVAHIAAPQSKNQLDTVEAARDWAHYLDTTLVIEHEGTACFPNTESVTSTADTMYMSAVYRCATTITDIQNLHIRAFLFRDYFETADIIMNIHFDNETTPVYFNDPATSFPGDAHIGTFFETMSTFFWYGVEHIALGYDHLLFLVSVMISVQTLLGGMIAGLVFAIGHAITLFASSYGIITVPAAFTEPLIALTIVFVALATLYASEKQNLASLEKARIAFVAGLGLIHGLGFANSIQSSFAAHGNSFVTLLSFVIGLELAQSVVIAMLFYACFYLKKYFSQKNIIRVVSITITLCGIYWFLERCNFF